MSKLPATLPRVPIHHVDQLVVHRFGVAVLPATIADVAQLAMVSHQLRPTERSAS